MALLSVIVPAYNEERYIKGCLDSIKAQTFQDFECIIINDGSTDNTQQICENYAKSSSKYQLINTMHEGVANARNQGLARAAGEYLIFIDSDDNIVPDMFELMLGSLMENAADLAECGINYITEKAVEQYTCCDKREIVSGRDILLKYCDKGWLVHFIMCNKMFRRSLFEGISFPLKKVHEDEYVQYQVLYRAKKAVLLDRCMYQYYKRKGSIMDVYNNNRANCYIDFSLNRIRFFEEKDSEVFISMLKVFYVTVFENYASCKKMKLNQIYSKVLVTMARHYYKDFWNINDISFHSKLQVLKRIIRIIFNKPVKIEKCY